MKVGSTPLKGILLSADMGFFYFLFIRQLIALRLAFASAPLAASSIRESASPKLEQWRATHAPLLVNRNILTFAVKRISNPEIDAVSFTTFYR